MTVGSQELDRSILERKDRDELVAIAEAFGQKPTSRAKKADIVDLILDLTGVGPGDDAVAAPATSDTKPKRGRRSTAAPDKADEQATDNADDDNADDDKGDAKGGIANDSAPQGSAVSGSAQTSGARAGSGSTADSEANAGPGTDHHDGARSDSGSRAEASSAADGGPVATASANGSPNGTRGSERGGVSSATNERSASSEATPAGARGVGDRVDSSDEASRSTERAATGSSSQQHGDGEAERGGRAQQAKHDSRGDQPRENQGQQAKQHQGGGNQGSNHGSGQGGNQGGGNQGGQGGGNQGGNQSGGKGQQNGNGDAEPGNRRRRRRNRDRDPRTQPEEVFQGEPVDVTGLLDLRDEGYGFLRLKGYLPSKDDVYVSVKQVRQFSLRKGDHLKGAGRPATRNEKNPALLRIDEVNGQDPEKVRQRPRFEDLTPLFPDEKLRLEVESDPENMTARIVDLLSPIGKGQRGLIVSPPKAGKTTVMKTIARSIEINNPEAHLIVLLVDERPEEVTDFRRWLRRGEVAASTFDRPSDEHTQVSELVIERAKRMVEEGKDVVIILDGITRLARAYNLAAPASGRIMSGGIDAGALYPPKKFFGAARNVEEGGSLTIMATALVETNSRMDDAIFEEFKATGNMELKLDRKLADRRIYPAIDVDASGTRHEELLFERRQLQQVWKLRRVLSGLSADGGTNAPGLELLVDRMKTFKSNDEFLAEIAKAPSIS